MSRHAQRAFPQAFPALCRSRKGADSRASRSAPALRLTARVLQQVARASQPQRRFHLRFNSSICVETTARSASICGFSFSSNSRRCVFCIPTSGAVACLKVKLPPLPLVLQTNTNKLAGVTRSRQTPHAQAFADAGARHGKNHRRAHRERHTAQFAYRPRLALQDWRQTFNGKFRQRIFLWLRLRFDSCLFASRIVSALIIAANKSSDVAPARVQSFKSLCGAGIFARFTTRFRVRANISLPLLASRDRSAARDKQLNFPAVNRQQARHCPRHAR